MTNEERDIITRYIERVGGVQNAAFGSVPSSAQPLPPVDPEADSLIKQLFAKYSEAPYRLTQTAFVQEHALAEAQNRIKRLEYELQQAQQQQQSAQSQPRSGGFLSSLFGGGQPRQPSGSPTAAWNQGGGPSAPPQYAPPPPQYAPGYQPGMFPRQGSGFLGSALTTAAGVAGGLVVGNALMDMFTPGRGAAGGLAESGGGFSPIAPAGESPWAAPQSDPGYVDQGNWTTPDQGGGDQASWDQASGGGDQSSWNDPGSSWDGGGGGDSGSWDDNNT